MFEGTILSLAMVIFQKKNRLAIIRNPLLFLSGIDNWQMLTNSTADSDAAVVLKVSTNLDVTK